MSPPARRRNGTRIAIGVFLAVTAAAIPGALRVQIERDATLAFLPGSGEVGSSYERYLEHFPGDIGTIVVATGDLCRPEKWQALIELSEDLESLSVVDKVTGLPTVEYVSGAGDSVEVADFIDLRAERDAELCRLAASYRPYRSLLLTEDLGAMALYVRGFKDLDEVTIDAEIKPVVERHRRSFLDGDGGDLFQAGSSYQNAEVSRLTAKSPLLVGVAGIIMLLAIWWLTRTLRAGVLAVLCGGVGVFWTFALMGYLGIKVDPMSALVTQVLIPLGAAFTIHASSYSRARTAEDRKLIPRAAIRPFVFAIVTTMVGFGATAISTIPNVRNFGLLGVFGIAICAVMTMAVTFPALSGVRADRRHRESERLPAIVGYALRMSGEKTALLIAVLAVFCVVGSLQIRVEYGPRDYLSRDNPVRRDMDRGDEFFNRINAQVVISTDGPDAALQPGLWREIRSFVREMEREYPGMRVSWIYDQVSELSLAFTADEVEPVALPDSSELIAQYLLLLDPREVEPFLDSTRSRMTVVFRVPWRTSTGFRPFKRDVLEFAERTGIEARLTGKVAAFWEVIDRMAIENVQSLAIGLGLVLLLLWSFVRSLGVALIATLVNAIPVLGSLAFLGFMRIPLDLGSSVVSAIALGIVVDDTGHLIARYDELRRAGSAPEAAVRRTLAELWKPVLTTSLVIVIGFSVMNFAELAPFHTFSRTLSMAVIFAVFGDLVLLPALLIRFDRRQRWQP